MHVTDSNGKEWDVSHTDPNPSIFNYSIERQGVAGTCTDYPNTVKFVTDTGATGSAHASVRVCVGVDLKVGKGADSSFTRTYKWGISKNVDKTLVKLTDVGRKRFLDYITVLEGLVADALSTAAPEPARRSAGHSPRLSTT